MLNAAVIVSHCLDFEPPAVLLWRTFSHAATLYFSALKKQKLNRCGSAPSGIKTSRQRLQQRCWK
jgi:hypothetical protein